MQTVSMLPKTISGLARSEPLMVGVTRALVAIAGCCDGGSVVAGLGRTRTAADCVVISCSISCASSSTIGSTSGGSLTRDGAASRVHCRSLSIWRVCNAAALMPSVYARHQLLLAVTSIIMGAISSTAVASHDDGRRRSTQLRSSLVEPSSRQIADCSSRVLLQRRIARMSRCGRRRAYARERYLRSHD